MLEYAGNGHYYWGKDEIREYAEQFAKGQGLTIEDDIRLLQPGMVDTVDSFFQQIEDNLREGQMRLVSFLDEAPPELKSVVDFLNKQMERAEVLLVEARQYEKEGLRVVAPTLFGYTEEARQVKKIVTVTKSARKKWNKEMFFADAKERLSKNEFETVTKLVEKARLFMSEISFGTGKLIGSFPVKLPQLAKYSILNVNSNGDLCIPFGGINKTGKEEALRDDLRNYAERELQFNIPDNYKRKYPVYPISSWQPKTDILVSIIDRLLEAHTEEISE